MKRFICYWRIDYLLLLLPGSPRVQSTAPRAAPAGAAYSAAATHRSSRGGRGCGTASRPDTRAAGPSRTGRRGRRCSPGGSPPGAPGSSRTPASPYCSAARHVRVTSHTWWALHHQDVSCLLSFSPFTYFYLAVSFAFSLFLVSLFPLQISLLCFLFCFFYFPSYLSISPFTSL